MPSYTDSMTGLPKTNRRKLIRDTIAYLKARITYRKQLATIGRRPAGDVYASANQVRSVPTGGESLGQGQDGRFVPPSGEYLE